jgi:hypothetical protein
MTPTKVEDLAVRYGAAWAERDLDAIMAMHTDDTVFHLHGGAEPAIYKSKLTAGTATRKRLHQASSGPKTPSKKVRQSKAGLAGLRCGRLV